jgi:hypothetical protein
MNTGCAGVLAAINPATFRAFLQPPQVGCSAVSYSGDSTPGWWHSAKIEVGCLPAAWQF